MSNLLTKIITISVIIFSFKLSYCQLTLENIFLNRKYEPKIINDISFFKNETKYATLEFKNKDQTIIVFNEKAKRIDSVLLKNIWLEKDLPMPDFTSITVSNTDKFYLLKTNEEKLFRRAGSADYYITDGKNNISKVGNYKLSFPSFSVDDTKIAYVKENNIYWYDIESKIETQATFDGKWNSIINGKSDWVYEEEFSLTSAFLWSTKNDKIAYLKFDETAVKEYTYPLYFDQNYPTNFSYKYPKAGEQNSKITAHFYDCKKKKNYKIDLSKYSYEYIPKMFSANDAIYFMMLNRHQDSLKVTSYNFITKQTKLVFTDVSDKYVEVPNFFYVLKNNSFITTSERDAYNHLYHFDENGKQLKQLTNGNFEVTDVYGIDEKNKQIYFQSNEGNEIEKIIRSLNYETLEMKRLSNNEGTNSAVFSNDFSVFIHTFSNAKTPPKITIQQTDLSSFVTLENNKNLQDSLSNIPQKNFLKISINDNLLNACIIKPANFDSTKKHPLFMYVYGGPGDQQVLNEWRNSRELFYNYLAEQGYVVACIDNRGTTGRGTKFKHAPFLQLGKVETEDQIAVAKYFGDLSFIDKNRIGIFGWSFGGFISLLSILQKDTPFKTAVAIAPVTNWKFYDNIYTERYMHTPEENPEGYEQFNPISLAKNLSGNLLIIHATADDNVHFQNAVEMINALNEANKTYQFYMYPDKSHSISGPKTRYDLFRKITEYLKQKL